jgi:hypothetical protein
MRGPLGRRPALKQRILRSEGRSWSLAVSLATRFLAFRNMAARLLVSRWSSAC